MSFGFLPRCRAVSGWALLVLLCLTGAREAHAATLQKIRYSTSEDRTRVVLDLSASTEYTHRVLDSPPRIVVEMPQSAKAPGLAERSVGDGYVDRVRMNVLNGGRLQVVLDLASLQDYTIFTLDTPFRIVVDVRHRGPAAPRPEPVSHTPAKAASKAPSVPPAVESKPVEPPPKRDRNPVPVLERPVHGKWVIAIDAGHGGEDQGAHYHDTDEKDITLALAKELKEELDQVKGVEAILVRKGDYFIPLRRRWTLAEKQGANLFVSLHCNASKDKGACGTEVFFLSLKGATDEAATELAVRENAVDEKMGVPAAETDDLGDIIFDMMQTDVLSKSQLLAEDCLDSLFQLGTVYNRGVKQAGFAVLKCPRMPSVLVEAAFLSNRKENKMLRDKDWRQEFSKRLAEGLVTYIQNVDPQTKAEKE